MSKVEQGTEEVEYQELVPIEGHPGLYTYKYLELDEARLESLRLQIRQFEMEKLNAEMIATGQRVDLGELKLLPLEGYPGFFTFRPVGSEQPQSDSSTS